MFNSVTLAKFIVAKCNSLGYTISVTKMQKLLFIAYGTNFVAKNGERLCNEQPQAWPFGPVFPSTRNAFIGKDLSTINLENDEFKGMLNDEYANELVDFVLKFFGSWTAKSLIEWTHKPESPWSKTKSKFGFKWGNVIEDCLISEYFNQIIIKS